MIERLFIFFGIRLFARFVRSARFWQASFVRILASWR